MKPFDLAEAIAQGWYDELVVEVRAGRLAETTVHAFLQNGVLLVPAHAVFDLVEVRARGDDQGQFRAMIEPEHTEVRIDPASGQAWMGDDELPVEDVILLQTDENLYVGTSLIEKILGTGVWFDLADLTMLLDPVKHLPLGRRVSRERAREALRWEKEPAPPDRVYGLRPRAIGGATFDWSLSIPSYEDLGTSRYRLGLGANVLGGALNLRYHGRTDQSIIFTDDALQTSWIAAWPENRWIRQVHLGSVLSTGPRPRNMNGASIGNSPFLRPIAFGQTLLTGWLNPNWEVELYRSGELTDFARVDEHGYYELEVPIDYGSNPVEVRAYGPNGEMRVVSRAIPVGPDRIPAGKFEYEISAGECLSGFRHCQAQGNIDLRYGLNRSWTLRTGAEAFKRRGIPDLLHPYGVLSGSILRHWTLRAEAVGAALGALRVSHEPSPDFRASASHTVFATNVAEPILSPPNVLSRTWADVFWRPRASLSRWFLSLNGYHARERQGWQARGILQLTAQLGGARWTADWRESQTKRTGWTARSSIVSLGASTVLQPLRWRFLKGLFLRAGASFETRTGELDQVGLSLGKNLGGGFRFEAASTWQGWNEEPRVTIGLSTNGPAFRSHHRMTRSTDGRYVSSSFLDGSFVWNGAVGRLEPFPYRSSGRGGLSGKAFIDANANDWRDPGEEAVPNLRLRAGDKAAETDAEGRYSLWNLTPFEITSLEVIPGSLRNPLLVPRFTLASVHVLPNGFREINLPLVPGTEVLGRIITDVGVGPVEVGGLEVVLRSLRTGKQHRTTTFRDGQFYFMTLPPGEYEVMIGSADLDRLGVELPRASRYCMIPAASMTEGSYELDIDLVARRVSVLPSGHRFRQLLDQTPRPVSEPLAHALAPEAQPLETNEVSTECPARPLERVPHEVLGSYADLGFAGVGQSCTAFY
jgi:hypothetical protein